MEEYLHIMHTAITIVFLFKLDSPSTQLVLGVFRSPRNLLGLAEEVHLPLLQMLNNSNRMFNTEFLTIQITIPYRIPYFLQSIESSQSIHS